MEHVTTQRRLIAALGIALLIAGAAACKKKEEGPKQMGPRAVPVSVARAVVEPLEIREESVGYIESRETPTVSAEVSGRVAAVLADNGATVRAGDLLAKIEDADLRLRRNTARAAAENAEKNVARLQKLFDEKVIPESQYDDAQTQLTALRDQLAAAERDLKKSAVIAPISGKVQSRLVAEGNYVNPGKEMFIISGDDRLQIHLPFPETVAARIAVGQPVRMTSPVDPGTVVEGKISEIRPLVSSASRSIDAVVNKANPGGWKAGASVTGAVLVGRREAAVLAPALCVVLRPAGEVVYVLEGDKVRQAVVTTGVRQGAMVEITSGLNGDETLVADGAAFLTDGAAVKARQEAAGENGK